MELSRIQVLQPGGGVGTLDLIKETTVKQVLREVADGGWVVLKGSTRATADSAKKDVVCNKVRLPGTAREELMGFPVHPSNPSPGSGWKIRRPRFQAL